ncbi:MAG: hypothetical protein WDW38_010099 [Sanguina aurantia]
MPCAPAPAAAFAAEHDAYRPALGTPQGFLTLLRDLPPRVGVNRKLREYVVRADNDSLERVGLYLSKGVRVKDGDENAMESAEVCGIYACLQSREKLCTHRWLHP